MERIITAAEAKTQDALAIASGISSLALMQTAAQGIADAVLVLRKAGESVTAVCGTGNNGGDGVCAAWLLKRAGVDARIALIGDLRLLLRMISQPFIDVRLDALFHQGSFLIGNREFGIRIPVCNRW